MLEAACRPAEVETDEIIGDRVHVRGSIRDQVTEGAGIADSCVRQLLGVACELVGLAPPVADRCLSGRVSGKNGRSGSCEHSGQRFGAHPEAEPTPARRQHPTFVEVMDDEDVLPNLAVQLWLACAALAQLGETWVQEIGG